MPSSNNIDTSTTGQQLAPARPPHSHPQTNISTQPLQEPSSDRQPLAKLSQKREYISEADHSSKRSRKDSQSVPTSVQPLSEANLEEHNRRTGSTTSKLMEFDIGASEGISRKRPSSQPSLTSAGMTQKTVSTLPAAPKWIPALYRIEVLARAKIFTVIGPPPEEIQSRINAITQRTISDERKGQLHCLAEDLCNAFILASEGASREDDLVEPIHCALSSICDSVKFTLPRKSEWAESLKPAIVPWPWCTTLLKKSNDEANDPAPQPSKRQNLGTSYISPDTSLATMPPPASRDLPKPTPLKIRNPHPDITVGFRSSAIVQALIARGLHEAFAGELLDYLQTQRMLCSDPANGSPTVRFPIIAIEGKAYATGVPIYEAQNQVAVAGSCMTKLQHDLADLSQSKSSQPPLAFSICTEGPYVELWVHYTTMEHGVRSYNMNLLKICHASILEAVVEFLMLVDNLISWARMEFLNDIVEQLVLVERALRVGTEAQDL